MSNLLRHTSSEWKVKVPNSAFFLQNPAARGAGTTAPEEGTYAVQFLIKMGRARGCGVSQRRPLGAGRGAWGHRRPMAGCLRQSKQGYETR